MTSRIRGLCLLVLTAVLSAGEAVTVQPMGYASLAADGSPRDVVVAVTRTQFTALVEAARRLPDPPAPPVAAAIGPGAWTGSWSDGRWTITGRVPAAVLGSGAVWLRVPVWGVATAVSANQAQPAWRQAPGAVEIALPGGWSGELAISTVLDAVEGAAAAIALPSGSLTLTPGAGFIATDAAGSPIAAGSPCGVSWPGTIAVLRPVAPLAVGALSFDQEIIVTAADDRLGWRAVVTIRGQEAAPERVELRLPAALAVLGVDGAPGWSQDGPLLRLRWPGAVRTISERRITVTGALPSDAALNGTAVAVGLAGAVRGGGRLAVTAGTLRFEVPAGPGLRRLDGAPDEQFRIGWDGAEAPGLTLRGAAAVQRLGVELDALLLLDPDRVRIRLRLALSGDGVADHLRLRLGPPWRVRSCPMPYWPETEGIRLLPAQPLGAGTTVVLDLEADRLGGWAPETIPAIAVLPRPGLDAGRVRWLVADEGPERLRVSGGSDPGALAAAFASHSLGLGPTARARAAAAPGAALAVVKESARANVEAHHWLGVDGDGLRWSMRLAVTPLAGALDQVVLTLPPGATLVSRSGEAVAWSENPAGTLTARFVRPLDRPAQLVLELAKPWSEGAARDRLELAAISCDPPLTAQTLALVEDDEVGQIVRRLDGWEERPAEAIALPAGIDRALLKGRTWTAVRPVWTIALERERLTAAGGVDAIASLVDIHAVIDPDGALIARATWHVINRSRTQLALRVPEGCDLWEVRVAGAPVRPRALAAGEAGIPVVPLRTGEAATRIQVVWRQRGTGLSQTLTPLLPRFTGLRVNQALWRFTAPPGTGLAQRGAAGSGWEPLPAGDAAGGRVQVLAEELRRLRALDVSGPARARLEDQLVLIDQELADHLALLERLGSDPSRWSADAYWRQGKDQGRPEAAQLYQQRNSGNLDLLNDNRQQLAQSLDELGRKAQRSLSRRGGLGLDRQARWSAPAMASAQQPELPARLVFGGGGGDRPALAAAIALPVPLAAHQAGASSGGRLGLDLLPAQDGEELTLKSDRIDGEPPQLDLRRSVAGTTWLAWLAGIVATGALVLACWPRRR